MTYKCYECGHIFEDGEEKICREDYGESHHVCPSCGGAYGETVQCAVCHGAHLEEELMSGVCDECVEENSVDYDTFVEFLGIEPYYPDQISNLEEFWFTQVMDLSPWDMPRGSSHKMRKRLMAAVKREVAFEKMTAGTDFRDHIRHYMVSCPTAKADFAEFLAEKSRKEV